MKERMKQEAPSKGDFICWCGKAWESLSQLRKHQEFLCPITMRRRHKEYQESIEKMKAKHLAQHKADLREWNKEKANAEV